MLTDDATLLLEEDTLLLEEDTRLLATLDDERTLELAVVFKLTTTADVLSLKFDGKRLGVSAVKVTVVPVKSPCS